MNAFLKSHLARAHLVTRSLSHAAIYMEAFSFPVVPEDSYQVDRVAEEIKPPDAPRARKVAGDGNCLFRSASVLAWGVETGHRTLRSQVMDELSQFPDCYAKYFIYHSQQHSRVHHDKVDYRSLLNMTLSHQASKEFSTSLKSKDVRNAYVDGIIEQARVARKNGKWSSLLEIAALASVLGCFVRSVYPEKFHGTVCGADRKFMDRMFYPRQQEQLQQEQPCHKVGKQSE